MVLRSELLAYCQGLLTPERFKDYCPNGLQVEGASEITHLVTGVTASLALIEAALDLKAQALLVHHGVLWQGDDLCITSVKYRRLKALFSQNVNLIAYHLPLDAHVIYGNSAQLALQLGLQIEHWFLENHGPALGCVGTLAEPVSAAVFADHLTQQLGFTPIVVNARQKPIQRVAWCTGAAERYIVEAHATQADAYITGEISESTAHLARELGIDFFAAGHHATERYGVRALGRHLAERFQIQETFVDLPNPA